LILDGVNEKVEPVGVDDDAELFDELDSLLPLEPVERRWEADDDDDDDEDDGLA
jgi:hypothetical protein